MNKIEIKTGAELFKLFNELGTKGFKNSGKTVEVNVTQDAREEYAKICRALEQYGRSIVNHVLPRDKQLIADANYQVNDIIKSSRYNIIDNMLDNVINKVKQTGKPVEFNYGNIRCIAEILNGKPRFRIID